MSGGRGGGGARERERERSLSCPSQPFQPHDIDDTATYLLFAFFYQCIERLTFKLPGQNFFTCRSLRALGHAH